jgi:hypothetical protein
MHAFTTKVAQACDALALQDSGHPVVVNFTVRRG